jgi:hypothetical protein
MQSLYPTGYNHKTAIQELLKILPLFVYIFLYFKDRLGIPNCENLITVVQ